MDNYIMSLMVSFTISIIDVKDKSQYLNVIEGLHFNTQFYVICARLHTSVFQIYMVKHQTMTSAKDGTYLTTQG